MEWKIDKKKAQYTTVFTCNFFESLHPVYVSVQVYMNTVA